MPQALFIHSLDGLPVMLWKDTDGRERQGRLRETDARRVSVSRNEGTVPCRRTDASKLCGTGQTDKGTRTKNPLNRQNYPKKGLLSDKIAHFCYQQHCYWKKSRSIFFSLHHIVPVQFHKGINPEAAPVPALKVEI